jgi:hypothetical protein
MHGKYIDLQVGNAHEAKPIELESTYNYFTG